MKKSQMKTWMILSALCVCSLSCESEDINKTAQGQACLDSATSADAQACADKVSGIESPAASRIRVGVLYLQQGFNKDRFKSAYDSLKVQTAGQDQTVGLISHIKFAATNPSTGATPANDSISALAEAKKTGSGGLLWLATATRIGTLAGGAVGDYANTAAGIASADAATLGALALDVNNSYCKDSSAQSSTACKEFSKAVADGGSDPTAVGNALKTLLANTSN